MRCQLIAELSTNHGGDVALAAQMIRDAATAGADWVKLQTYRLEAINPSDPQADWLRQAHLDREDHQRLLDVADGVGINLLSTPFDAESLEMLRDLHLSMFKVASSESANAWWRPKPFEHWVVSWPWGVKGDNPPNPPFLDGTAPVYYTHLTAIPLYATPPECVGKAPLLDGWSDHVIGIDACLWAIAQGAKVVEVHFTNGHGRVMPWDKTPEHVQQLRAFAEACETMRSGVKQQFRDRWVRA